MSLGKFIIKLLLNVCRPRKYTLKGAKRFYAMLRDTQIYFYKSKEETNQNALHQVCLQGE